MSSNNAQEWVFCQAQMPCRSPAHAGNLFAMDTRASRPCPSCASPMWAARGRGALPTTGILPAAILQPCRCSGPPKMSLDMCAVMNDTLPVSVLDIAEHCEALDSLNHILM